MDHSRNDVCQEFCFDRQATLNVKENMLDDQEFNQMADIFKVMGDSTRLSILYVLSKHELCVCDIAVSLGMSVSRISHQLRTLKANRLVKYRRDGKNVYYSLDDEHVNTLFLEALAHVRHN